MASASFDLLRVETDLIAPIDKLELSRDHLTVDYGPVQFPERFRHAVAPLDR